MQAVLFLVGQDRDALPADTREASPCAIVAYCSSTWLSRLSSAACARDDAGLGQGDLRLIIGRVYLDQEIAGLDALVIVYGDDAHFAGDPAA